jgi:hypothetical protein
LTPRKDLDLTVPEFINCDSLLCIRNEELSTEFVIEPHSPNPISLLKSEALWKELWHHLYREFLEHAHDPREIAIAEMDYREIESVKAPLRHDLDESPITQ